MGSGWIHISLLPVPYPYFKIGENPNPYPNPIKSGLVWVGTHGHGFVVMPTFSFLTCALDDTTS